MSHIVPVILAGGQGTRFWPISRMKKPKQFLSISESGESLIQATARRARALISESQNNNSQIMIVTNVLHQKLIEEHVPGATIISEPVAKNTAPAIGLAAIYARHKDPHALLAVFPADHAVRDDAAFLRTMNQAIEAAAHSNLIVTIGIRPTSPHTGYGYIKSGRSITGNCAEVFRFFEKPNADRAKRYVESGEYFWNSGMFIFRAEVILKAIQEQMPDLHEALIKIESALGTNDESTRIAEVFSGLESVSIDIGVLEHVRNAAVVMAEPFGWNDVGSWDAWSEHFEHDQQGNLLHGNAMLIDCKDCVVNANGKLIAVLGAKDLVVIDSGDATLICPRERVQDVKKIVEQLKLKGQTELI